MQGQMDAKMAASAAKGWLVDLFAEDGIHAPRLEEICLGDDRTWKVTISFGWDSASLVEVFRGRTFKVVRIDDRSGKVVSMTHRTFGNGASD